MVVEEVDHLAIPFDIVGVPVACAQVTVRQQLTVLTTKAVDPIAIKRVSHQFRVPILHIINAGRQVVVVILALALGVPIT